MGTMTDLLQRSRPVADPEARSGLRPSLVAAGAAALAAAGGMALCIVVALIGWAGTGTAVEGPLWAGLTAWLAAHGSGMRLDGAMVTVIPLGLTLCCGGLLWLAGRSCGRSADVDGPGQLAYLWGALTAPYALIAVAAALLDGGTADTSLLRTLVGSLVLAAVFTGTGLLRGTRMGPALTAGWPEAVRSALVGAGAVVAAMLAFGAALVTVGLVADFGTAATAAEELRGGTAADALLTLVQVLLLPNATLLAVSFLLGPGFVLGTGTTVAPSGVTLGAVPGFPLLAALPAEGPAPWWMVGLVCAPVLAGMVGAVVVLHRFPVFGLDQAALRGGAAGLVGGAASGLLTGLAGGALGPGRMADVGALAGQSMLTGALAAAVGGAAAAVLLRWWGRRRERRAADIV